MKDKADFFGVICGTAVFQLWAVGGSAKRPRGDWHSYAWSFTPRRFFFCLFFFFRVHAEFELKGNADVSQSALLLFALFLRKYERPKRGAWAWLGVSFECLRSEVRLFCEVFVPLLLPLWTLFYIFSDHCSGLKMFWILKVYHQFEFVFWSPSVLSDRSCWTAVEATLVYFYLFWNQNNSWELFIMFDIRGNDVWISVCLAQRRTSATWFSLLRVIIENWVKLLILKLQLNIIGLNFPFEHIC